jgi:hypothetical protein
MRALLLFLLLFAVVAGAYTLGLLPETGRIEQLRAHALRLSHGSDLLPGAQREPGLTLDSELTWVRGSYGYAKLRFRNEGTVPIQASAGRVRCTALDTQRRTIGSWQTGDLGSLDPGEEITLGIGIPLRQGRLQSMDCRVIE